jgi:biopolymer transport protein TolR
MIFGMSRRAARISRHARRSKARPNLNIVSLMDIFTILVFYLMVNSTSVEVLPNPRAMQLPESIAQQHARETLVLMVTEEDILVQGRRVLTRAEAEGTGHALLAPLKAELESTPLLPAADGEDTRGEITIMADRAVPYSLIKKVMATCAEAKFNRISLAVIRRTPA